MIKTRNMKLLKVILLLLVALPGWSLKGWSQDPSFGVTATHMGPFHLGMSIAQVEKIAGKQKLAVSDQSHVTIAIKYSGAEITVIFEKVQDGNGYNYIVDNLITASPEFITAEGAHVGSAMEWVQDTYLQAFQYKEYPGQGPGELAILVGTREAEDSGILFEIKDGKVISIDVGYVQTN